MSEQDPQIFVDELKTYIKEHPKDDLGIITTKILVEVVKETNSKTFMGVDTYMTKVINAIQENIPNLPMHFHSAAQVFRSVLSMSSDKYKSDWKQIFLDHVKSIVDDSENVMSLIPGVVQPFLTHGMKILTRGYDSLVLNSIIEISKKGLGFHIIVSEGSPQNDGVLMANELRRLNPKLQVTLIPDSAIGTWIPLIDVVLLGTDVVLEDGSLLAPAGTYIAAALAKLHNKVVYCVCETFKFMRKYIIQHSDIKSVQKQLSYNYHDLKVDDGIEMDSPGLDITPAKYITTLLTEKGAIPPTAVTHELTKLLGVL